MILDLEGLDRCGLVLLLDLVHQLVCEQIRDGIDVSTTLYGRDGVGERDLLWLAVGQGESDFPSSVFAGFVDDSWLGYRSTARFRHLLLYRSLQIHVNVLIEERCKYSGKGE